LQVSEYTDKVDVLRGYSWRVSKGDVIQQELDDVFRLLGGLLVAGDFKVSMTFVRIRGEGVRKVGAVLRWRICRNILAR
jgi:hypothetical protein